MINLKNWKLGKCYNYAREVEPLNQDGHEYKEYNMNEDGLCYIGRSFVTVTDGDENILSFIIDGYDTMYGASMKLIWKG